MARVKKEEHKAGSPEWMATYSDLVTLLLCFFILLFSFSTLDIQKYKAVVQSMNGSLGMLDSGTTVTLEPMFNVFPNDTPTEENEEFKELFEEFSQLIEASEVSGSIDISIDERGLLIRFLDNVLFDSGKADLKPDAKKIINEIASVIKQSNKNVRIEGHTDNVPINTPRFPSNWELSTTRAVNVVKYLIEVNKVEPQRLSAVGYADQHPIADNRSIEGKRSNRRVDMVILKSEKEN